MKGKNILLLLILVLISFMSVLATNAFLTDEVSNDNGYTIGNVKITLDEANVDELGVLIDDTRVEDNDYHLIPGYTYIKDPTVTVKRNSVDSYVRVLITINKINELKDIYGKEFTLFDIYNDWGKNWSYIGKTSSSNNKTTYEYRYDLVVNGLGGDKKLESIFKSFTVPKETTIEQLEKLDGLEVETVGYAIQTQGFENAEQAWNSFDE